MARENGILADKFNTCPLDKPVPLSIYKDKKKKDIPRFRPRSLRDYMRIAMKYNNKSEKYTLDETDYNKEALEDMIRHWFTEARRDDYIIEQILQEFDLENPDFGEDSNTWDGFFSEFLPSVNNPDTGSSNSDSWAEFFNEFAPFFTPIVMGEPVSTNPPSPIPYAYPAADADNAPDSDPDSSQSTPFMLPNHLQLVPYGESGEMSRSSSSTSS